MPFFVTTVMFLQAIGGVPHARAAEMTSTDLVILATDIAQYHHLNVDHFIKTIQCESGFDPNILGDKGKSYGIAQIYLPAHPDITKEMALDPTWAMQWMASQWENDNAKIWTCWRLLYGDSSPYNQNK